MGFIFFGLFGIIAGMTLGDVGDSPGTWDSWDVSSVLLMIAGAVAVLVGIVVHVVAVNRGDW